jgi:restriction endonuclease Mrr
VTEPSPEPAALSVRTATLADVGPLVRLVTSAYRGDASRAGWTSEADLIDGDRLCDLLKHYSLGVTTTVRTVEDITVDAGFLRKV